MVLPTRTAFKFTQTACVISQIASFRLFTFSSDALPSATVDAVFRSIRELNFTPATKTKATLTNKNKLMDLICLHQSEFMIYFMYGFMCH